MNGTFQFFDHPFRHWVLDDAFPCSLIEGALAEWPTQSSPHWHLYDSASSHKLGTKDVGRLPPACRMLFDRICCLDVHKITGMTGLFPDFTAHGAGLHWIPEGGFLNPHLDSSVHPTTKWHRRLSACLYLNSLSDESGTLELYDIDLERVKLIPTKANRLVLFECTDYSYHGVPSRIHDSCGRKSIASFFWSRNSPNSGEIRTQAEFV